MYFWIGVSIFVLFHIALAFGLASSGRRADEVSAVEYAERKAGRLSSLQTMSDGEASCGVQEQEQLVSNM